MHTWAQPLRAAKTGLLAALAAGLWCLAPAGAHAHADHRRAPNPGMRVVDLAGIGTYRMAVCTASPAARHYFEQGIVLAWGFNFLEAVRSFREAARRDHACALCYWGEAYALGPSINHDMTARDAASAYQAIVRAKSRAAGRPLREQDLIRALAARYSADPQADRDALDRAYAAAMRTLVSRYPGDPDILTLAAEAAMDVHPRDYWQADGTPQPWTRDIIAWLERAIARAPDHPGALHYLVHALEDSPDPVRVLPYAERLAQIAPGLGHLVHMAAHIDMRIGRYHDATVANERAIAADRAYLRQARANPAYVAGYARHNVHFLWASAMMEGATRIAQDAAAALAHDVDRAALSGPRRGTAEHFLALPLYTDVRFGQWAAIRTAPRPQAAVPYAIGVWHYARAIADARSGDLSGAQSELDALKLIMARSERLRGRINGRYLPLALLDIAAKLVAVEIAVRRGDLASAIAFARAAAAGADDLEYGDPPIQIVFSAQQTLGALLLAGGRAGEAEAAYRADLARFPENGYALAGLAASLRAQRRAKEAADVDARLARAWAHADIPVPRSPY